mmetsp:Transcript_23392/g.24038  ORF Transcript_23392/g.24038 Transcript_23392/m.24038 type:complete len:155 (+) Transcript_23392:40-504(+)
MSKRASTRTVVVSKALRKVDQETRKEVKDKRLQMLEADNYNIESTTNEVDEADFSEEEDTSTRKKKSRTKLNGTNRPQRKIRDLDRIIDSQLISPYSESNFVGILAQPSLYPPRHFCSVCGNCSNYSCVRCGSRFCSIKCNNHHKETRCLKFSI